MLEEVLQATAAKCPMVAEKWPGALFNLELGRANAPLITPPSLQVQGLATGLPLDD